MAVIESNCLSADLHSLSARSPEDIAKVASRYVVTEIFSRRRDLDRTNISKIYQSWLNITKALSGTVDRKFLVQLLVDAIVLLKKFSSDPIIAKLINKQEEDRVGLYCTEPCTTFIAAMIEATMMHCGPSQATERSMHEQLVVTKFSSAPFRLSRDGLQATLTDIQVVVGSPMFTRHDPVQAQRVANDLVHMPSLWRQRAPRDITDYDSDI